MTQPLIASREHLIHALYEAAELEHTLMCTYLYAAFSMKDADEGLSPVEAAAVARWRRAILDIAIDEMGHLTAVWNITAAIGGAPRFGRANFPLDPGMLPAGVVVKLTPFDANTLQHFIHLERPQGSDEPDGEGYERRNFTRGSAYARLTPMAIDYDTVGEFYARLQHSLAALAASLGEAALFCGDPALQLSEAEVVLKGAKPVLCSKTAIAAFEAIVTEGEGATSENANSHFCRFRDIRDEYEALKAANPAFAPAHPAATNPVLRRPPGIENRIWIEDPQAAGVVDIANTAYQTMLRLIAYAYALPSPSPEKALVVDASLELMKAMTFLGESAARRPAGPANPECNAGMSFTALRDAAALPAGASARRYFVERLGELARGAAALDQMDPRVARAAAALQGLAERVVQRLEALAQHQPAAVQAVQPGPSAPPPTRLVDGAEVVDGDKLELTFNTKLCIHSRYCVTGAPKVFLANVEGPWIHPDAMDVEELASVARNCPSGAIQYRRKDGAADEQPPLVNLIRTIEGGPNAFRGQLSIDGKPIGYRATLCRCGASKNKPFCDGSHHAIGFQASGEPATGEHTAMLEVRDGPMEIAPQTDGPLMVRGNMEIISGAGRMVARMQAARLCRCGHSQNKPFCDGSHVKAGFRST